MNSNHSLQSETDRQDGFARVVKASVARGEIAGAVVAIATHQTLRVEALGFQDQSAQSLTQVDTIYRVGSMAKMVFTTAALVLLEEGKFKLHDEISKWMPELADRRVLRTPDSEVDDTVPARRSITMFDVLAYQLGIGIYLAQQNSPLLRAMVRAGVAPGPELVAFEPDEFITRLGSLPLAHHPGDTFMYHTPDDVLRVLIPRIAKQSLSQFLQERVFEPLGMHDSGLSVPASKRHRLSTCYFPQAAPGAPLAVWDRPDQRFASDPIFPNSMVSTARDYLNFAQMLLGKGEFGGRRFLSSESLMLMLTDHLSTEQKQRSPAGGFWDTRGWGMGGAVYSRPLPQGPNAGSFSWFGGYGGHFIIDPQRGSVVLSLIPRIVRGGQETALGYAFEAETYRDVLSR